MTHAGPIMAEPRRAAESWTVLPSFLPVPGMGVLAVNSFLLTGREPMLVDTGLAALGDGFLRALEGEIDPDDLRWIWLSHMDADHIGNLRRVLDRARKAKVVTNFLGRAKMELAGLDVTRVEVLEPGARFEVGGRTLVPVRPPYYDAPETMGFLDLRDGALFAADSFGALLPESVPHIAALGEATLRDGLVAWSSIDAPWLSGIDRAVLERTLGAIERIAPEAILSGHLPPAESGTARLAGIVHDAWCAGTAGGLNPLAIEHVAAALDAPEMAAAV